MAAGGGADRRGAANRGPGGGDVPQSTDRRQTARSETLTCPPRASSRGVSQPTVKTTPIQQEVQGPYARRRGGKPATLASTLGLHLFPEEAELESTRSRQLPLLLHGPAPCCPVPLPLPLAQTHNIGRGPGTLASASSMIIVCAGCEKPILDKFLLNVLDRTWHSDCVRCFDCHGNLTDKCFSREGKLFCRNDFFRRYGTKCGGCAQGISPSDLVRKARDKVFHLNCFTCMICRKQLSTGEELYVLDDNKFICKEDYITGKGSQGETLPFSGSEEEEDDDTGSSTTGVLKHHLHGGLHPGAQEGNNNSVTPGPLQQTDSKPPQDDSEDQGSLDGDPETRDSQTENKSPEDGNSGSKRRGPRTTIKAKQLEILKTAFSQTPKPTRHIREQLAKETGLPMRVIQVWFQNKRSKERRLKQLTSMGRGPFFGGSRKIRGFTMNLSPGGMEEPPPGFPYFAASEGKFDFGYGAPGAFHHDFFPGHHPHGPPTTNIPFNPPGGGMEGGGMGVMGGGGGEFGSLPGDGSQGFLAQPPPQPDPALLPHRASPEFISSQGVSGGSNSGFSEPQPLQSEGLVW